MSPDKVAFLNSLKKDQPVKELTRQLRVTTQKIYAARQKDLGFEVALKEIREAAALCVFEPEAIRRAVEGWDEPVFYQGCQVGVVRKYSDTLLIRLLEACLPRYYKRKMEVTGEEGGALEVRIVRYADDEQRD